MSHRYILKVKKFQLPTANRFVIAGEKPQGGQKAPPRTGLTPQYICFLFRLTSQSIKTATKPLDNQTISFYLRYTGAYLKLSGLKEKWEAKGTK